MTKKDREQQEILDMLHRDREAHERLLQQTENWRNRECKPDAKPETPQLEQRPHEIYTEVVFADRDKP